MEECYVLISYHTLILFGWCDSVYQYLDEAVLIIKNQNVKG
jgi:hypothetical protein